MPVVWLPGEGYYANSYIHNGVLIDAGVTPMALAPHADRIERIVLTHTHYDHIAFLREIADLTGAEICVHALDAGGLSGDAVSLARVFGGRAPMVPPGRLLDGGEEINGMTVIHTPGHTPGGISLWDADERALFSGDTVFTGGSFGRCDFPGGDAAALAASIGRLSELEVEALYPGHGEPVRSGGTRHIAAAAYALRGMR
ncbi:MBL fold metallo-hydrolase [Methanofollis fontis]|uniref:MBL fold metallo-hydrolase n=1 Tax=Methanofollis fontis TaxID=2052832 RepID=A0A483CQY8_9EURY|nr:MBL fold metallo-hydrolase [Methanofollis fontis]TAJ45535.1 MBL fold metallo-hydrolase [Methanofollis fontis]